MTTLTSFNKTDGVDDHVAADVNNLIAASLRSEYKNVETLSGTRTLLDADTPIQRYECGAADRIVKAPTENSTTNHPFWIVNASAAARTITFKNNAGTTTLGTITQGTASLFIPDGNGSYLAISLSGGVAGYDFLSVLTAAEVSVTGTTTATISRMHVCSGSSNYTVTLPAASGNTGKFLGFRFTNTGITTLDGDASETLDGVTTRAYYQDQAAILICDGSNWFSIYQKVGPRCATISGLSLIYSTAQTIAASTSQVYNMTINQTTPGDGDYFTAGVFLNKGSYTCAMTSITYSDAGKLDWTLNGVSQTTGQDWYSAGLVYNVTKTFTLTVPFTGYHTLKAIVNGKNGSSSAYYARPTQIDIYPSAY